MSLLYQGFSRSIEQISYHLVSSFSSSKVICIYLPVLFTNRMMYNGCDIDVVMIKGFDRNRFNTMNNICFVQNMILLLNKTKSIHTHTRTYNNQQGFICFICRSLERIFFALLFRLIELSLMMSERRISVKWFCSLHSLLSFLLVNLKIKLIDIELMKFCSSNSG